MFLALSFKKNYEVGSFLDMLSSKIELEKMPTEAFQGFLIHIRPNVSITTRDRATWLVTSAKLLRLAD